MKFFNKLRTAIRITGIINRIYTDEYVIGSDNLSISKCVAEKNKITRRNIGYRNILALYLAVRNINIFVCKGTAADQIHVCIDDKVLLDLIKLGNLFRANQLYTVTLMIIKAYRIKLISKIVGNGHEIGRAHV